MGFKRLNSVEKVVLDLSSRLKGALHGSVARVGLVDALGRIAARDYVALRDLPEQDKSVLDGYAVRSADIAGASQTEPAFLKVVGESRPGSPYTGRLAPGTAVRVATGALLPRGADTVVPVEAVRSAGNAVVIYKSFAPGYGVMKRGEDFRAGDRILSRGERIGWWHIGVLASQGYSEIEVIELPRVSLFVVGDEVVEPGSKLESGRVYNSTGHLLRAYLRHRGFDVTYLGVHGDDVKEIETVLEEAVECGDVVLAVGGTSVGEKDFTARVLREYVEKRGGVFYHGFLLRPGRPLGVGVARGKLIASLSGFPVAAWAQVYVVIERIIYNVLGLPWPPDPLVYARVSRRIASPAGVLDVIRVRLCLENDKLVLNPLRVTGSGILSTLLEGNAVLLVPPESTGFDEGSLAPAYLLHTMIPSCGESGGVEVA